MFPKYVQNLSDCIIMLEYKVFLLGRLLFIHENSHLVAAHVKEILVYVYTAFFTLRFFTLFFFLFVRHLVFYT